MYQNTNQEVYYYNVDSSRFCLIYDFSANKGDTIILDCYTSASTGKPMNIIIDSVDNVNINGTMLRRQIVRDDDGLLYSFSGDIIERIGHTFFMFPTLTNNIIGPLRCYSDSLLGLYSTGISQFCSYTTGVDKLLDFNISVYPNPVLDRLIVDATSRVKNGTISLKIIDILGNRIIDKEINTDEESSISTQKIESGTYFLYITQGDKYIVKKIIKY